MKKLSGPDDPHASLEPTRIIIPDLDFKLDYLCRHLGIFQQAIADALKLSKGAISQWKNLGVPKARVTPLCTFLGISQKELEIVDREAFKSAIQQRFSQTAGVQWRFFSPDHSRVGLGIDIIPEQQFELRPTLKALFKVPNPNHQRELEAILRVTINDRVRFKYPVKDVVLKEYMPVQDVILIVEHPEGIQALSMDEKSPNALIHEGHYYFPGKNTKPLFIGKPTGIHSAFLLFLALPPPEEVTAIISNQSGEVAADWLAAWLGKGNTPFKIMRATFNVNN